MRILCAKRKLDLKRKRKTDNIVATKNEEI